MADFANQDFGSESEDDDFNPAPAVDSDDEADSKPTEGTKPRKTSSEPVTRAAAEEDYDNEDDIKPSKTNGARNQADGDGDGDEEADGEADADGEEEGAEVNDDEDEDEEDEEDDDEEDDVQGGHRRKRRKRDPRNQFIDVEAEVDDEDEDVDEDEEGEAVGDFLADTHPDDLNDLPPGADKDDRRHRELDRQRELQASLDAEKQAALLKERYGRNRAAATDAAIMPQRLLLPSVDDPTIWGVRCKPGKEKEIVFAIMKRIEDRANTREPLAITSAFERGGTMAGYVYVEGRKQSDIMTACDGVTFLYPRTKMVLIPIGEMPDLLRVHKSKQLEPGAYVRIKRGKYQGDLAQVEDVETNGLDVSVRLVPRLDYGQNEDANASPEKRKRPGFAGGNPAANRPPPRLFSEQEAKRKHGKFLQQVVHLGKKQFTYLNDTYIDGFLIKDLKLQHLITEDVNPTLEEVTRFAAREEDGVENLDLTALAATLKAAGANAEYLPGDMVEVYQGEQRGVRGKAIAVHGDIVKLTVTEGDLQGQVIEAPVKGLRKKFNEGDHVKVVGASKYHDEVGMIVKIRDDRVTLLTDSNNQEITVFSKDLREATDAGGATGTSKYDLYDLVQLDAATVACVIKVDRESLRVLDQTGSVRSLLPSNISNKIEKRRNAVATDRDGSEIRVDDTIKEQGGFGERKQGRVLHIHRNFLFALSRTQTENAGVFVVRTANVLTVAAKGGRVNNAGPDLTKMNPMRNNGAANGGGQQMPPPKTFGRDKLLGRTVTIRRGPHKGLLGIVKDTTDSEARVELHTKSKIVNVPKDAVLVKDPITGQTIESWKVGGPGRGKPGAGDMGRTPYGGRTPSAQSGWQGGAGGGGGRTPMASANGGRTPAWNGAGGRTPAWSGGSGSSGSGGGGGWAAGGRTPAAGARAGDGGRTPAWGSAGAGDRTVNPYDGSRTAYGGNTGSSSWSSSSRTPYSSSAGFSGSRTPAWQPPSANTSSTSNLDAGSRTPAHNPYASAPTPSWGGAPSSTTSKAYDAPTPTAATSGGAYSAPTPGAYAAPTPGAPTPGGGGGASGYGGSGGAGYSAPTPGPYGGAPTPGGPGQTPGAWAAETPGVGGGDDGDDPRYE